VDPDPVSAERIRTQRFGPKLPDDCPSLEQLTGVIIRQTGDCGASSTNFSEICAACQSRDIGAKRWFRCCGMPVVYSSPGSRCPISAILPTQDVMCAH